MTRNYFIKLVVKIYLQNFSHRSFESKKNYLNDIFTDHVMPLHPFYGHAPSITFFYEEEKTSFVLGKQKQVKTNVK